MPIDVARYEELKSEVDSLQRKADRSEGALAQLMERLKDEFGCDSLKKAEKLSAKLKLEASKAEEEYSEALERFEEKWEEVLE